MAEQLLDPNDPRPVYVRIAEQLRQSYEPGSQLPSTPKLAEEWGVARETIRNAIDVLRKEGLVVSWQGRGTYFREQAEPDESADAVLTRLDQIMDRIDELESRIRSLESSRGSEASQ